MQLPPDPEFTRVYSINVNGFSTAHECIDIAFATQTLQDSRVSIMGFIETNIAWGRGSLVSQAQQSISKALRRPVKIATAASTESRDRDYLPGGTMTVVTGNWTGRVIHAAMDSRGLGRWSYITIVGRAGTRLTIITAYQVCKQSPQSAGPDTAYQQQWRILRFEGNNTPEPRKQFMKDLTNFIKELRQQQNHEVILMMDANDHPLDRGSQLSRFAQETNMVDIHAVMHGTENEPNTYQRGSRRIDFMFCSPGLTQHINKSGIEGFCDTIPSDHRGLFCDINLNAVLRGTSSELVRPNHRDLQSTSLKDVREFRRVVLRYLRQHRVEERLTALQNETSNRESSPTRRIQRLEAIDRDIQAAFTSGSKAVRRGRGPPWSPALIAARLRVQYWKLWVKELKTKRDYSRHRYRLRQHLLDMDEAMDTQVEMTTSLATKQLSKHQAEYKQLCTHPKAARMKFLEERAQEEALHYRKEVAAILKRIMEAENSKEDFSILRRVLGKIKTGAVQTLLIPDTEKADGTFKRIVDGDEITQLLIARNEQHFHQAHGTPFTQGELFKYFGRNGTGAAANSVLDGTFLIDDIQTTDAAKALLRHLRRPDTAEEFNQKLSGQEWLSGFKKWREDTSTSHFSSRDLSKYKALYKFPVRKKSNNNEAPEPEDHDVLFDIFARTADLALQHEHPLERWTKVVNTMLEKSPNNPRIDKLRVIHLFEADMNFLLGVLWNRRLIKHAEEQRMLSADQWGNRAGRNAIDAVLMKQFSFITASLTRTPLISFDKDAKACYDRMVMSLVNLRAQQLGMPAQVCNLTANTADASEYHLKTSVGVSTECYRSSADQPLYGFGQGKRDAPAAWLILSTLLMETLSEKATGAVFCDPQQTIEVQRAIDGYVDDVTAFANNFIPALQRTSSWEDLIPQMQIAAQWWEELLHASGGKLELSKCFYYVIGWVFENKSGKVRPATILETPGIIQLRQSEDDELVTIERKEPTDAHRTLGAWIDGVEGQKAAREILQEKSNKFARAIAISSISRRSARRAYQNIYLPSMSYSLATTSLQRRELKKIESGSIGVLISKMGYNRCTPAEVVFGPTDRLGVGIRNLYTEQNVSKINQCLKHIRHSGQVGRMIMIAIQWYQMRGGVSWPILEYPYRTIPHAEGIWLTSLQEFLAETDFALVIPQTTTVKTMRAGDRVIMEDALKRWKNRQLDEKGLRQINDVRIFLQVERLSDITNATGDKLDNGIWHSLTPTVASKPNTLWPVQPKPTPAAWTRFRQFVLTAYCNSNDKSHTRLSHPLGKWTTTTDRKWPAYYDTELGHVAIPRQMNENTWDFYTIAKNNRHTMTIQQQCAYSEIGQKHWVPIDQLSDRVFSKPSQAQVNDPTTLITTSLTQYLQQLQPWEADLLRNIRETAEARGTLLVRLSTESVIYAVSDGGAKNNHGAFGFVIATPRQVLWTGQGIVRGHPITSFRAEGYGRLAALCFLKRYIEYFGIQPHDNCQLRIYTDSKSLLQREQKEWRWQDYYPSACLATDHDVLRAIKRVRQEIPLDTKGRHVKGHQDDDTPLNALPWEAVLNVKADHLATEALEAVARTYENESPPLFPLTDCKAYLRQHDSIITSNELPQIRFHEERKELEAYWCKKNNWATQVISEIDWESIAWATKRADPSLYMFAVKWAHNWLPVAKRLHRQGEMASNECVFCKNTMEDYDHVPKCPRKIEWRHKFLQLLQNKLDSLNTDTKIETEIMREVRKWLEGYQTDNNTAQHSIGWGLFLRGIIHKEYGQRQEEVYRQQPQRKRHQSGRLWATAIIEFIWTEFHSLWKARNSKVHEITTASTSKAQIDLAIAKATAIYNSADSVLPSDHDVIFQNRTLEDRLKDTPRRLIAWTSAVWKLVRRSIADEETARRRGSTDIRWYFDKKYKISLEEEHEKEDHEQTQQPQST